jgi:hypothetical protein
VVVPGLLISITPAQLHISLELSFRAGKLAIITVGQPGAHGAAITGVQGCGVSAPIAAAVAAATIGFAMLLHIPKGAIFAPGLLSIIVAIGIFDCTLLFGGTFKVEGAAPNVHFNIAPPETHLPIT